MSDPRTTAEADTCCGLPRDDEGRCVHRPDHPRSQPTTGDPRVTDEALEPAARALYEHASPDIGPYGPRKDWGDDDWYPEVRQTWFDGARAVMDALPGIALQMGQLSDALLIVDGYDVMEGDEVPERELWAVVEAARKVLDAAPQPVVDREALTEVAAKAIHRWDKRPVTWDDLDSEERSQYRSEAECVVDAVLALLNGSANA